MRVAQENHQEGSQEQATHKTDGLGMPPVLTQRVPSQFSLSLKDADESTSTASEPRKGSPDSVQVYDLFDNYFCIATLVFLAALIAYYIVDSLPLGETYVAGLPYGLFALAGIACALPVLAGNHFGGVPRAISAGLALTAGLVGVLAAHPALLRINAMTDSSEIQVVEYVRMTQNHFDPVDSNWPSIDMIGSHYWVRVPGEVVRAIPIRRGGLGFYQADLTAIRFELELGNSFASTD